MGNWQFDWPSFALGAFFLLCFGVVVISVADWCERRRIRKKIEAEERGRKFARR